MSAEPLEPYDALAALNLKPIKDSTPTESRESMRTHTAALGPFEDVAAVAVTVAQDGNGVVIVIT
ncbi:hypothetical protein [Stenotrophomonas sp. 3(2025)]|uniref:hypothetical protein n=1 Tax=Stenotrophomonas sp. 3(2025) TaxID=3456023 RepID=UPI0040440CD0